MKKFIRLITAIILLVAGIVFSGQTIAQVQTPSFDTVKSEAERGGYKLISMQELWQLYQQADDNLLLVDTRQEWEYHAGYIKTALNFSMNPTWMARMIRRGALEQILGKDKSKILVFY
jgi:predicted sulfurtransferase